MGKIVIDSRHGRSRIYAFDAAKRSARDDEEWDRREKRQGFMNHFMRPLV